LAGGVSVAAWTSRASLRSMLAWEDNSNSRRLALGTHDKLFAMTAGNAVSDVTPVGFNAGRVDATLSVGFGASTYGNQTYGTPRQDTATLLPATTWSLDNWGEYLVGCHGGRREAVRVAA
jgi:hypothetical protein